MITFDFARAYEDLIKQSFAASGFRKAEKPVRLVDRWNRTQISLFRVYFHDESITDIYAYTPEQVYAICLQRYWRVIAYIRDLSWEIGYISDDVFDPMIELQGEAKAFHERRVDCFKREYEKRFQMFASELLV
jgi:hypothetical protein